MRVQIYERIVIFARRKGRVRLCAQSLRMTGFAIMRPDRHPKPGKGMKEAGDIGAISIPFAAGAAAGATLMTGLSPGPHTFLPVALAVCAALSAAAVFMRKPGSRPLACLLFLLCGVSCYMTAFLTAPIRPDAGPLGRAAAEAGSAFRDLIDSLPLPHPDSNGLVKALTTGDRSGLSRETVAAFRGSGAAHILALSGLHLGIIYMLIARLTTFIGHTPLSKALRLAVLCGATLFYTVMAGGSPSIVRAFLFILIGETGKFLGRRRRPLRTWLAALTIQLTINPLSVKSIGFQLSYAAMLGIHTLFPRLSAWYPKSGSRFWDRHDPMRRVWDCAALTISCQAFTAPLAWLTFHTFPKYFLLTNLIAMPLTTLVMTLSLLTATLYAAGTCPDILLEATDAVVQAMMFSLKTIAAM